MNKVLKYNFSIIFIILIVLNFGCKKNKTLSNTTELKVMTWNIWGRLNLEPRYTINGKTARERVVEIIKESEADIITMTETYGSAAYIAEALKYHYYTPKADANLTIFSRYPIENFGNVKDLSPFSFIAATAKLPNNKKVRIYNIWLTSGGRHIVEIKNQTLSDQEFNEGDENRHEHIQELLQHQDFKQDLANKDEIPLIVAGDFNCVSHLDYNQETKSKGLNYNRILANNVSLAMQKNGFVDTYRFVNSNITNKTLGYTWTTVGLEYTYVENQGFVPITSKTHPEPEYRDPFARIDFIYCAGDGIKPISSKTIINHASNTNRSFPEFPSDHGAVLSVLQVID